MNAFFYTLFGLLFGLVRPELEPPEQGIIAPTQSTTSGYCAHSHAQELLFAEYPELESTTQEQDEDAYRYFDDFAPDGLRELKVLPVVFHIIHNNGPENISDAQVLQGLDHLNDAFANLNYYDQGTGEDTEVQFCLAKRDPDGNATTGIVRVASPLTDMTLESDDLSVKDLSRWDPFNYINIWLVAEICSNNTGCDVAGYAYFPSSHGNPEDGIVVEAEWMGSSEANSTVLAHEMGHYLGLYHTFENGCTNDDCMADGDRICDTPPDQSTIPVPCNGTTNSCSTDVNVADPNNPFTTDQNDMVINYMDYGDWACYSAFTQGQADRIHYFVEEVRSSLLDSDACLDPCFSPITADFSASALTIPVGEAVDFTNNSINATMAEWFVDGTSFATTTDASYTFNTLGLYTVTLVVANGSQGCIDDISVEIEVVCNTIADFLPSASTVDAGQTISFSNNSTNAQSYEWLLDNVSQGGPVNFTQTFLTPGVFNVCLTANGLICNDTFCFAVTITEPANDCSSTYLKTFGNAGANERGYVLLPTGNGSVYIGGSTQDSALIMLMDGEGTLLWQRSFLFADNSGVNIITDMKLDADNYIVGCGVADNGANNRDGFAFRYDPANDNLLWVQNHQHASLHVFNYDIHELSPTGNFLVTGQSHNNTAPGLGCDGYLFELNRNTGAIATVNEQYNLGSCETFQTSTLYNGSLYAAGRYNFAGGGTDKMRGATTRFDLSGSEIWTRLYLVDVANNARLYSPDILIEDDTIVQLFTGDKNGTAALNPEVYLAKANLNGELAWAKEYSLPSNANLLLQEIVSLPDGYALLGLNASTDQLFILKTDKSGNPIWAKSYGGGVDLLASSTGVEMIAIDEYLYVTGYSDGFGTGDEDIAILKLNAEGEINSSCVFVEELLVNAINFPNPYDGQHSLTAYASPIGSTNPSMDPVNTSLEETVVCFANCQEICDNGLDDDGDGLIDCYDPDCCMAPSCENHYYSPCPEGCVFLFNFAPFGLEEEWQSMGPQDWCSYNTPITGDIDGDGVPEVIGKPCSGATAPGTAAYHNLLIVDGQTGQIEDSIITPAFYYLADGPAIADVDNNGFAEIFIMASDHTNNGNYTAGGAIISGDVKRRVLCYEYDGTTYVEKWMSNEQAGYQDVEQAISVSVVDFNSDGVPELYLGSQIFNSLTGELIVAGGASQHYGHKPVGDNASISQCLTVAADVLPDDFCLNCNGLELVAGGMVFSIGINPITPANSMMNVEVILPGSADGFTSIADLDLDGDLDAVVTTTDDNFGYAYCWDIQTPSQMFSQYTTPSSNAGYISQANIADFDGDGFPEIGVCSKSKYQVLKPVGNTLSLLWILDTDDQSGSTGSSVFDFNFDGASEVVYRAESELQILDGTTGMTLTSVPCVSGTRVEYPVVVDVDGDGETEILCSCENTLYSYGSAFLPWRNARQVWNQHNYFNVNINDDLTVPIFQQQHHIVDDSVVFNNFLTMYANQVYLASDAVITLDSVYCSPGDSMTVAFQICNQGERILQASTPLALYAGDPTSSPTATLISITNITETLLPGECVDLSMPLLVLGDEDLYFVVNDNGSLPPIYDLATDFPLTIIPECDYTNNMLGFPNLFRYQPLDLGPDQEMCDNGVVTLDAGPGFDLYEWNTLSNEQSITVTESGTYIVTATIGCLSRSDTVEITIDPQSFLTVGPDVFICEGDTAILSIAGGDFDEYQWYPSGFLGCDTCTTVMTMPDTSTSYIVVGTTDLGCFSTDTIAVTVGFEFYTDTFDLCFGDSLWAVGQWLMESGTYIDTLFNPGGCDTVYSVTVNEMAELTLNLVGTNTCFEEDNGTATATIGGGVEPIQYFWVPDLGNTDALTDLAPGTYSLTVLDAMGCSVENEVVIEVASDAVVPLSASETTCYNSEDGVVTIDSSGLGLAFSLDNESYSTELFFDQLGAGTYNLFIQDELGCIHLDTFEITGPPPIYVQLPPDTTIELGQSVRIGAVSNILDSAQYHWVPFDYLDCVDCQKTVSLPLKTIVYTVTAIDSLGCTATDSILVTVFSERRVFIPNAFSPNFDGFNDVFYIFSETAVESVVTFQIFDRWGELVFRGDNFPANDPRFGWDGHFNGQPMNPGVFVYFAKIRFIDGEEFMFKGDVTILK